MADIPLIISTWAVSLLAQQAVQPIPVASDGSWIQTGAIVTSILGSVAAAVKWLVGEFRALRNEDLLAATTREKAAADLRIELRLAAEKREEALAKRFDEILDNYQALEANHSEMARLYAVAIERFTHAIRALVDALRHDKRAALIKEGVADVRLRAAEENRKPTNDEFVKVNEDAAKKAKDMYPDPSI